MIEMLYIRYYDEDRNPAREEMITKYDLSVWLGIVNRYKQDKYKFNLIIS